MNLENIILMWNEPGTESYIVWFYLYKIFRLDKYIEKLDKWFPGPGEIENRAWLVMGMMV